MDRKKAIRILIDAFIGVCVIGISVTSISAFAMVKGIDMNIQTKWMTIMSNSEVSTSEVSIALILVFAVIGGLIASLKKVPVKEKRKF